MHQAVDTLRFQSEGRGLIEVTEAVESWVGKQGFLEGLLTIFCRHTSASLLIQENAAPDARADLERFFERIAPEDADIYRHNDEGPDDMPSHIRAALTQVQISVPLIAGQLALGTWQGIYLFEHRRHGHTRELVLHLSGE